MSSMLNNLYPMARPFSYDCLNKLIHLFSIDNAFIINGILSFDYNIFTIEKIYDFFNHYENDTFFIKFNSMTDYLIRFDEKSFIHNINGHSLFSIIETNNSYDFIEYDENRIYFYKNSFYCCNNSVDFIVKKNKKVECESYPLYYLDWE